MIHLSHLTLLLQQQPVLRVLAGLVTSSSAAGWTSSQQPVSQRSGLHLLQTEIRETLQLLWSQFTFLLQCVLLSDTDLTSDQAQPSNNLSIIVFVTSHGRVNCTYLLLGSDWATLHLRCLVGGVLRGHTLHKLQTGSKKQHLVKSRPHTHTRL